MSVCISVCMSSVSSTAVIIPPDSEEVTCPPSIRSLNHQSAGALDGSHDNGRGSWSGVGSGGSHPDS